MTKPLLAEIRRKFSVSAAEVDHLDLHRRAAIGVTAVSPDLAHLTELLDAVERFGAGRPDIQSDSRPKAADQFLRHRLTIPGSRFVSDRNPRRATPVPSSRRARRADYHPICRHACHPAATLTTLMSSPHRALAPPAPRPWRRRHCDGRRRTATGRRRHRDPGRRRHRDLAPPAPRPGAAGTATLGATGTAT